MSVKQMDDFVEEVKKAVDRESKVSENFGHLLIVMAQQIQSEAYNRGKK
jgi:hypothetical protein